MLVSFQFNLLIPVYKNMKKQQQTSGRKKNDAHIAADYVTRVTNYVGVTNYTASVCHISISLFIFFLLPTLSFLPRNRPDMTYAVELALKTDCLSNLPRLNARQTMCVSVFVCECILLYRVRFA